MVQVLPRDLFFCFCIVESKLFAGKTTAPKPLIPVIAASQASHSMSNRVSQILQHLASSSMPIACFTLPRSGMNS
jgi:hypothetical protein